MSGDILLSVAEVAELRGVDHSTAWRLLVALERDHGAKLVRQKRTIFIRHDELRQSLARAPVAQLRQLGREVAVLRRRLTAAETRQKMLEDEIRAFRRMAHEWFTKKK